MAEVGRGTQIDAAEMNRLRWQCRRGLLELDLVLERFLERHLDRLQGEYLASFKTLLDYTDKDLWDLIRARAECRDARLAEVVAWMRNC
jgi:succinate dehydrogenase flavin-adding protein (antitoxin of CptAB toxin-antitoxin module)